MAGFKVVTETDWSEPAILFVSNCSQAVVELSSVAAETPVENAPGPNTQNALKIMDSSAFLF
jgi:hypothetical protein